MQTTERQRLFRPEGTENHKGLADAIGNTPLVQLSRIFPHAEIELFAKLEMLNPGGSIKDRPALNILETALANGAIDHETTIIESSSGNMGIGLAQVCAALGLRLVCVVDSRTSQQNIKMMEIYGATVEVVTEPDPQTNDLLVARINRVKHLVATIPGAYWCNQYGNLANAAAHHQTMAEITEACRRPVDYLFCATSSCGTLRGTADYVRANDLPTQIIAVDAVGSVIFGEPPGRRLIPGHGAARVPELYEAGLEQRHVNITEIDCVAGCRRLLQREGILAGGSSGAVIAAIEQCVPHLPPSSICVAILCDRGERYLDTIYSDTWVQDNLSEPPQEWRKAG